MMLDETESTRPPSSRRATWMRLLFVLLFALFYMVAEVVALVIVAGPSTPAKPSAHP